MIYIKRRGLVTEAFTFVIVILAALVLSGFYFSQVATRGVDVSERVTERESRMAANNVMYALYNNEVPGMERTYMKALIDSIKAEERKDVYYGEKLGGFHADEELIYPLMDDYFGEKRWRLVIDVDNVSVTFGNKEMDEEFIFKNQVPVAYDMDGEVRFYVK